MEWFQLEKVVLTLEWSGTWEMAKNGLVDGGGSEGDLFVAGVGLGAGGWSDLERRCGGF